jgi:hypothetical protein
MATHMSDVEQQRRARERTAAVEAILKGSETGATEEIVKSIGEIEAPLKARAEVTGAKTAGHAADVLEAQRLLVSEKDLGERFLRIANRLKELQQVPVSGRETLTRLQRSFESLRPLLRLTIRSIEFRKSLFSALLVAKHVIEEYAEGSVEEAMEKGEKEGIESTTEYAKKSVNKTVEKIQDKLDRNEDIISDRDWERLSSEVDSLFSKISNHSEFRSGIDQLFSLASTLSYQARSETLSTSKLGRATESLQHEAKDLIAQFSGEEELERLLNSIQTLVKKLDNDNEAQQWWDTFKEHTLRSVKSYKGVEDINVFRDIFRQGIQIFREHIDDINEIINRANVVLANIGNDKLVARLQESLAVLKDDLFWEDQMGNRYFDADAAGVLVSSIGETIKTQFKYLALPDIARAEEDMEYSLSNLVITATLPDRIDFHLESFGSLDTAAISLPGQSSIHTEIYLTATIRGITARAENVAFSYRGTTLSESGIMNMEIPGPGADLAIDFVMRPFSRASISSVTAPTRFATTTGLDSGGYVGRVGGGVMKYEFVRIKSHFDVPDLNLDYDKRTLSHRFLVPLITTLFKNRILDRFESGIEESLDQGLMTLGQKVTDILNQASNPLSLPSFGSVGLGAL